MGAPETAGTRPLASIAIPTLNGIEDTLACLASLERHTPEPHELLLVDNGSTDGSAEFLAAWAARRAHVRFVGNAENRGFAAAVNQALALARGAHVVLLNNDTLLTAGWLSRLVDALRRSPGAGVVGPLTNAAASAQAVTVDYGSAEELAAFAARLAATPRPPRPVRRVVGMCLLARREVLDAVGALDERFGAGTCEDDDWCLRASAAGFGVVCATDVFVHHHGGRTFAAARIDAAAALARNVRLFEQKWGCSRESWALAGCEAIDPALLASNLHLPLPTPAVTRARAAARPLGGEPRLAAFLERGRALVLAGDGAGLERAFAEPRAWGERERAHQALRRLCQLVLELGPSLGRLGFVEPYAAAARGLAGQLAHDPAEPTLLNAAGVLLHELTRHEEACALFERALALDPTLPAVAANLAGARLAPARGRLQRPGDEETARRLRAAAARARPSEGLTLSLCMIVRDEEALLPLCLASVRDGVDEIVVVDTGSRDRTVAIAERFGARVLRVPWTGSFATARNAGLEAASGDWILFLDADERLIDGAERLRPLLSRGWREGFFLELRSLTGRRGAGPAVVHPALRLFRNRPGYRFEGRIHEQITRLMPTYLPERFELAGVRVLHEGYLAERVAARDKPRRNLELLELEAREAPSAYVSFNLGSEFQRLGEWPTAAAHFERAWALVAREPGWAEIGFAPVLALRTARARRECGRGAQARALLERALERLPRYTDLVFELALCALAEGEAREAERLFERCLELGEAPPALASTVGAGSGLARAMLASLRRGERPARAA